MKYAVSLFLFLFALFALAIYFIVQAYDWPVRVISCYGNLGAEHQAALQKIILPWIRTQPFIKLDLIPLQQAIGSLSFAHQVRLQKIWPHTLRIEINTEEPVALLNQKNALNRYGELLYIDTLTQQNSFLPKFFSTEKNSFALLSYFQQINQLLIPTRLNLLTLQYDLQNGWQLTLNNHLKLILGQKEILTKCRRFVKVYPKIFKQTFKKAPTIDLRYNSGLAISW